ncbi:MAG: hypothetical protein AABY95_11550 [Pseudomonadota bacterium]
MPAHSSNRVPQQRGAAPKKDALLFRFRDRDTAFGVTRRTADTLAKRLGMSETQVLHVALAKMAQEQLPAYEQDDGSLSQKQLSAIKRIVPQGYMRVTKSLL